MTFLPKYGTFLLFFSIISGARINLRLRYFFISCAYVKFDLAFFLGFLLIFWHSQPEKKKKITEPCRRSWCFTIEPCKCKCSFYVIFVLCISFWLFLCRLCSFYVVFALFMSSLLFWCRLCSFYVVFALFMTTFLFYVVFAFNFNRLCSF